MSVYFEFAPDTATTYNFYAIRRKDGKYRGYSTAPAFIDEFYTSDKNAVIASVKEHLQNDLTIDTVMVECEDVRCGVCQEYFNRN